jgi:hypothetical protein
MSKASSRSASVVAGVAVWGSLLSLAAAAPVEVFQDQYRGDPERGCFTFEAEEGFVVREGSPQKTEWIVVEGELERPAGVRSEWNAKAAPPSSVQAQGDCFIRAEGKNVPGEPGTAAYNGPEVAYKVRVTTPGTYRLYVRWAGRDGNTDSVYARVSDPLGKTPPGPGYFLYHGRSMNYYGGWVWDCRGLKERTTCACAGRGDIAEWEITSPGVYWVRLAAREQGTAVDALVFQTTNLPPPGATTDPEATVRNLLSNSLRERR